jgi:hypothetical protein
VVVKCSLRDEYISNGDRVFQCYDTVQFCTPKMNTAGSFGMLVTINELKSAMKHEMRIYIITIVQISISMEITTV